jgi:hypothetical protein
MFVKAPAAPLSTAVDTTAFPVTCRIHLWRSRATAHTGSHEEPLPSRRGPVRVDPRLEHFYRLRDLVADASRLDSKNPRVIALCRPIFRVMVAYAQCRLLKKARHASSVESLNFRDLQCCGARFIGLAGSSLSASRRTEVRRSTLKACATKSQHPGGRRVRRPYKQMAHAIQI